MICTRCGRDVLGGDGHGCRRPKTRVEQLEDALAKIIDALDAKDAKALENALMVGRGLTF